MNLASLPPRARETYLAVTEHMRRHGSTVAGYLKDNTNG